MYARYVGVFLKSADHLHCELDAIVFDLLVVILKVIIKLDSSKQSLGYY